MSSFFKTADPFRLNPLGISLPGFFIPGMCRMHEVPEGDTGRPISRGRPVGGRTPYCPPQTSAKPHVKPAICTAADSGAVEREKKEMCDFVRVFLNKKMSDPKVKPVNVPDKALRMLAKECKNHRYFDDAKTLYVRFLRTFDRSTERDIVKQLPYARYELHHLYETLITEANHKYEKPTARKLQMEKAALVAEGLLPAKISSLGII